MDRERSLYIKLSLEPIVAAIIGSIFFLVPGLNVAHIAEISWIVGALLAINNFTLLFSVQNEVEKMKNNICSVNSLCSEFLKINDDDFLQIRDDAIEQCTSSLRTLNEGITYFHGNNYYNWLSTQVRKCTSSLLAVSAMVESNWINDARENSFYQDNVEASKRRVSVSRIFITTKERLKIRDNRKIILQHINDGLNATIIYSSDLLDHNLKPIADKGFLIIDNKIVFTDVEPPAETVGMATKKPTDIKKYNNWYEQLKLQAFPASKALKNFYEEMIFDFESKYIDIDKLKQRINIPTISDEERKNLKGDLFNWESIIEEMKSLKK